MIYQGFASVYDELMSHAPYDQWTKWIETSLPEKGRILDLACGTGEISIRLAEKGFEVTGIDLSEEMLSYAQQKVSSNQPILFLQQDMREITGFDGQFDAVAICCDSLNYLKTKNDVIETFKSVFRVLKPEAFCCLMFIHLIKLPKSFRIAHLLTRTKISVIFGRALPEVKSFLSFMICRFLCGTEKRMTALMRRTSKERSQ